jgi:phosphoglucosamine mutase
VLGGEQSGHVIFGEFSTTGDGMLTALRVAEISRQTKLSLDELSGDLKIYPQLLVNVRIGQKKKLDQLPEVKRHVASCEAEFGDKGRVLVRFSGTEPLARVMVEGPDSARVEFHAHRIADAIRLELS